MSANVIHLLNHNLQKRSSVFFKKNAVVLHTRADFPPPPKGTGFQSVNLDEMGKKVLAIIPARGGSKGTPQKNIRPFIGHPLIAYSITAALFCRYASRVVVSTDSREIAEIAKRYGAEVPFLRSPELAIDTSRDIEFCQHVLKHIDGAERYGYIVILRPTSPIRPYGFIDAGILKLMDAPDADSLRTVTDAPATPYKMWHRRGGRLTPVLSDPDIPEAYNAPRQELPQVYWQTGHLDVIRRETIEKGSITGGYVLPQYIAPKYCVDIDTPEDFEKAERVYRQFTSTEIVMPSHPSPVCYARHTVGLVSDASEEKEDAFDAVEISTKRAAETAKHERMRSLTTTEMAQIECSAEWRGS